MAISPKCLRFSEMECQNFRSVVMRKSTRMVLLGALVACASITMGCSKVTRELKLAGSALRKGTVSALRFVGKPIGLGKKKCIEIVPEDNSLVGYE